LDSSFDSSSESESDPPVKSPISFSISSLPRLNSPIACPVDLANCGILFAPNRSIAMSKMTASSIPPGMPNWSGTIATIVSRLERDDNSLFDYT